MSTKKWWPFNNLLHYSNKRRCPIKRQLCFFAEPTFLWTFQQSRKCLFYLCIFIAKYINFQITWFNNSTKNLRLFRTDILSNSWENFSITFKSTIVPVFSLYQSKAKKHIPKVHALNYPKCSEVGSCRKTSCFCPSSYKIRRPSKRKS